MRPPCCHGAGQPRTRIAQRGRQLGEVRLGALPNCLPLPVFANVLKTFRAACPDVKLSIAPMLSAEQADALVRASSTAGSWRGVATRRPTCPACGC
jgi:DNA-binding transcriptional LysR family regulator